MRKFILGAIGAIAIVAMPATIMAQPKPTPEREERKPDNQKKPQQQQNRQQQQTQNQQKPGSKAPQGRPQQSNSQYGSWNNSWGKAPPAPPKHWSKKGDWHRHVRACQQRYKSYNASSDTYRTYSGKSIRCKL